MDKRYTSYIQLKAIPLKCRETFINLYIHGEMAFLSLRSILQLEQNAVAKPEGERGSVRSPLKKRKSVKNLKTLKGGSLSVSVNSEPTMT